MKAIVYDANNSKNTLTYKDIPDIHPKENEVKVKLKVAGLNRRDLFLIGGSQKEYKSFILGSDGAGIVTEVGENLDKKLINQNVIINPTLNWEKPNEIPMVLNIVGGPTNGTLAEYIVIPYKNTVEKPDFLNWDEAGTLSLSAMTAYRALFTKGDLQVGETVLIPGIGGGVGTFALRFAKAIGAKVIATSRNKKTLEKALSLGADKVLNSNDDWSKEIELNTVDLILDSIGPATFAKYFDIIKPSGKIISFGATSGSCIDLPLRSIFFPQISLIGTSMASTQEFNQMLEFIERYNIKPIVDKIYNLDDIYEALEDLRSGIRFGKIGISI